MGNTDFFGPLPYWELGRNNQYNSMKTRPSLTTADERETSLVEILIAWAVLIGIGAIIYFYI